MVSRSDGVGSYATEDSHNKLANGHLRPKRPKIDTYNLGGINMRDLTGEVTKTEPYYFANGGFADIWRAEWKERKSGKVHKVAVKILRSIWNDEDYLDKLNRRIQREALVWSTLSHPNITPFYGTCFDLGRPSTPCLVTPYLENGHANDYLLRHPEANRLKLVTQIAAGLDYLHNLNIVHGDIKASNVLINDEGEACLCDFGLSRILQSSGFTTKNIAGTCRWMAIELIAPDDDEKSGDELVNLTKATDVWAFGMTALEILTGRVPFAEFKHDSVVVLNLIRGLRPKKPPSDVIGDSTWSVIEPCWLDDPCDRPSIRKVGLALDLIHSYPEGSLDRIAIQYLMVDYPPFIRCPATKELDSDRGAYSCKWNKCSTFASLDECQLHQSVAYIWQLTYDLYVKDWDVMSLTFIYVADYCPFI